jgi:hypothetical protein
VSAFHFKAAYNCLKNAPISAVRRHLSNLLELIFAVRASCLMNDVAHEARKAIMRVGEAIKEQDLLFLLVAESNPALPADYQEKARELIDVLRELMRLRADVRDQRSKAA